MSRRLGIALVVALALAVTAVIAFMFPRVPKVAPTRQVPPVDSARSTQLSGLNAPLPPALPNAAPEPDGVADGPAGIVETLENSADPRAIEAALRSVLTTYASRSTRKPLPDAALERAIQRHLTAEDGAVVRAALAATRVPLMTEGASPELASAIASTVTPEQTPARRTLALEALNLLRPDRRGAPVLAAIRQSLAAPEPEVVSQALFALSQSGPSLAALSEAERAELAQRVQQLTLHHNPAVRGRALFALSELPDLVTPALRLEAAVKHLGDPLPYVRAEAANLAGRCRDPRAIHALVTHVSDLALARYELAFVDIDGRPVVAEHAVPGRKRVAEAALFAILGLSREAPVSKSLELTLRGSAETDARVLEDAALVRAWYRDVAAQLPR